MSKESYNILLLTMLKGIAANLASWGLFTYSFLNNHPKFLPAMLSCMVSILTAIYTGIKIKKELQK